VSRRGGAAVLPGPPYRLQFTTLEHETAVDRLPLKGTLPDWLEGALIRTAPARFEVNGRPYRHWFDGLAMLHRFGIAGGRVSYRNRFLRGAAFRAVEAEGRIAYGEFATDPCRTLFERVAALFATKETDNCNVNVAALAGDTLAFTESRLPIRFDPDTLETLGVHGYDAALGGHVSIAHPHHDAARDLHYSYLLEFGLRSEYRVFTIDAATGRQSPLARIPVDRPAYMHSIGMSADHLVLAEFPLVVNPVRLRFSGEAFIRNYRWRPERGLRFHVVDKRDGRVAPPVHADAAFAFHHVNAFADGDGALLVDLIAYPDPGVIDALYLDRLRSGAPVEVAATLRRYRVPLRGGGGATHHPLSDTRLELPRVNYAAVAGRRYRHVYGTGTREPGNFIDSLVKLDLDTGDATTWHEPGCYPGEPVFVPAPGAAREDAGVALSLALDSRAARSFLLVLDAETFAERARAEAPHHIPSGFHGDWFPNPAAGVRGSPNG
jgi:carotenoid cleavage dioxygenase-like enzyme